MNISKPGVRRTCNAFRTHLETYALELMGENFVHKVRRFFINSGQMSPPELPGKAHKTFFC